MVNRESACPKLENPVHNPAWNLGKYHLKKGEIGNMCSGKLYMDRQHTCEQYWHTGPGSTYAHLLCSKLIYIRLISLHHIWARVMLLGGFPKVIWWSSLIFLSGVFSIRDSPGRGSSLFWVNSSAKWDSYDKVIPLSPTSCFYYISEIHCLEGASSIPTCLLQLHLNH